MPVTPLHLGPGAVLKAVAGKHMSLTVFAFSQATMDLEVLVRFAAGAEKLHGFTNTAPGATVVLVPTVLLGRPLCRAFLDWWNRKLSEAQRRRLSVDPLLTWKAAWTGGAAGVYSHCLLDAIMHADTRPFAPFSSANPFIDWLSIGNLNLLCLLSLVVGCVALSISAVRTGRRRLP